MLGRLDQLDYDTKTAFSRLESNLSALLRSLGDEAADGPRLFTVEPLSSTVRHPGLTSFQMRLTLWCEHSKLPLYLLDAGRPNAGQYTITVPREWWTRAAPVLKAVAATVRSLLPVSISLGELTLDLDQACRGVFG